MCAHRYRNIRGVTTSNGYLRLISNSWTYTKSRFNNITINWPSLDTNSPALNLIRNTVSIIPRVHGYLPITLFYPLHGTVTRATFILTRMPSWFFNDLPFQNNRYATRASREPADNSFEWQRTDCCIGRKEWKGKEKKEEEEEERRKKKETQRGSRHPLSTSLRRDWRNTCQFFDAPATPAPITPIPLTTSNGHSLWFTPPLYYSLSSAASKVTLGLLITCRRLHPGSSLCKSMSPSEINDATDIVTSLSPPSRG